MAATATMALAACPFQSRTASARAIVGAPATASAKCDEKWQNSYFFEVSQWIHWFSFLSVLLFGFHRDKAERSDQSDHLN